MEKEKLDLYIEEIDNLLTTSPPKAEEFIKNLESNSFSLNDQLKLKIYLGLALSHQLKNEEALILFQEVKNETSEELNPELFADSLDGIARINSSGGDFILALECVHKTISIYHKLKNQAKEAESMNLRAVIDYSLGNLDSALEWFQKAIELSKQEKSLTYIKALGNSALVYRSKGEILKAEAHFREALEHAIKKNYNRGACVFYNDLADTQRSLGYYSKAKKNYRLGLDLSRKENDHQNESLLLTSYGDYLIEIGHLSEARQCLDQALKIYMEIYDPLGHILAFLGMGRYYYLEGKLEKSYENILNALDIIEFSQIAESHVEALVLIAEVSESMGKTEQAYEYLKIADELSRNRDSKLARVLVLVQRGRLCISSRNLYEAEMLLNESLWLSHQINHPDTLYNSQILLARVHLARYLENTQEIRHRNKSIEFIDMAIENTKSKQLMPKYLNALLIRGLLFFLEDNTTEAIKSLTETIEKADKLEISLISQKAKERLTVITSGSNYTDTIIDFKSFISSLAMEDLLNTPFSLVDSKLTKEDVESTFLIVFKFDEFKGTLIHEIENINLDDNKEYETAIHCGSLFSIAIAQGDTYHQDLYGPLPYGKNTLYSLIYSKVIKDPSQISSRSRGETFLQIIFVFPRKMSPMFYDREKVHNEFAKKMEKIENINQITKTWLADLRKNLLQRFIPELELF